MNRPDGLKIVFKRLCKYGRPGEIKTISYMTADRLCITGYADRYEAVPAAVIAPPKLGLSSPKTFALVSNITNGLGLQKDTEILKSLLESHGHKVYTEMWNSPNPSLRAVDVVVFLEVIDQRWFPLAKTAWMVPNSEWWYPHAWNCFLPKFSMVLCKTKHCYDLWKKFTPPTCQLIYTGFEAVDFYRPEIERKRQFLHLAGGSEGKNTEAVIAAWRDYKIPYPLVALISTEKLACLARGVPNLTLISRVPDVTQVMNESLFHIMPSQMEGYGHSPHESLGCGSVFITTDAAPMNEFGGVPRELAIPVWKTEPKCIALLNIVHPAEVAARVHKAWALLPEQIDELRAGARAGFLSDREFFRSTLAGLVGIEKQPKEEHRDIVLVPTYFRSEYLWLCLEAIASAEGGCDKEVWVSHDHHPADFGRVDPDAATIAEHFKNVFKSFRWIDRKSTSFHGNTYNTLELYKEVLATDARLVYLVEDDIIVEKDFFRWHEAVQKKGDYACSWVGGHGSDEGKDPSQYVEIRDNYSSLGTCWRREQLAGVVEHCKDEYYGNMLGYVVRRFPNSPLGDKYWEQDGLIVRVLAERGLTAAAPCVKRAYHIGVTGYHRPTGPRFTGSLQQRVEQLGAEARDGRLAARKRLHMELNDIETPLGKAPEWSDLHV